ncbi:MAG: UDP-N-acetylmuramate--L-alanine ligase [Candidatus Margulisiibacteriota bacterium]|jgi:UDP-N-acetylmuramate--alanine ligase
MEKIKKSDLVHFLGIGGCGMSAIAKIMLAKGYKVSGSDVKESVNTIRLRDLGAKVYIGHNKDHLRYVDVVSVSTAIWDNNPEMIAAKELNLPIIKRAETLSWLMDQYEVKIAVSGTHGKTTTTGMFATLLDQCKLNPTFSVGGDVNGFNTNAQSGDGRYFVTEADESDGSILFLNPNMLVVTNIEEDHLEYLGDLAGIEKLFWQVIEKLPAKATLVINQDNLSCKKLISRVKSEKLDIKMITYGTTREADYFMEDIKLDRYTGSALVSHGDKQLGRLELSIPGAHNLENALSVIALGEELGISFSQAQAALQSFLGTKRRFQLIGEEKGITVIDDFAHHPSEIKATLDAAKNGFKSRVICVFQPHRYTRTMFLAKEFAAAFHDADVAIITDIYAAGESPIRGVSGRSIFNEMKNGTKTYYVPKKELVSNKALEILKEGDIFLTLGAGDIHTIAKEILMRLKEQTEEAKELS